MSAVAAKAPEGTVAEPKAKKERVDYKDILTRGIIKENPVFKMLIALCPVLGVTSSIVNGVGMGVIVIFALAISNATIALVAKFTPDEVRIPVFITVIATLITSVEMAVQAFMPGLFAALGIFLPLVVTNCIILGRAEAFAAKNKVIPSILDGIGFGTGFALAVTFLAFIRELIGTGGIDFFGFFQFQLFPQRFAISLFVQPLGAFIALAFIIGIMTTMALTKEDQQKEAERLAKVAAKATA